MLSLDSTTKEEELREWDTRVHELSDDKTDYVCELKLDGMSLALSYERGRLERVATRGDGVTGEDVAMNVRTLRSVPLLVPTLVLRRAKVPPDFEVRGEVIMPLGAFERANRERARQTLPKFANARNAAAGTIRVLEPEIAARRGLEFYAYFLLVGGKYYPERQSDA
jgi:DNA ligase (NAD+)